MAIEYFALYSRNCKRCRFLDPEEPKGFSSCHFKKGNTECPAAEVQFVVVGKAKRWATLVANARIKRNIEGELRVLAQVAKQSPAFQSRFYDELEREISCLEKK